MSNSHDGGGANLEARVAELEAFLAKLKSAIKMGGTELRITAPRVRIDAPLGVEIQPILRTTVLHPRVIQGAAAIDSDKYNGMKIIKVPPFILPF